MALVVGTNCGFVTVAPTADPAVSNTGIGGYEFGQRFVAPAADGTIVELGFYRSDVGGDVTYDIGVHEHNAGTNKPAAAREIVASQTATAGAGWKRVNGLFISHTASEVLWLTIQADSALSIDDAANSGERSVYSGTGKTALEDPFPACTPWANNIIAIYALTGSGIVIPVFMNSYRQRRS